MNNKYIVIAFAVGLILGIAIMVVTHRNEQPSVRMEKLVQDSMDHAGWAARRDADRLFMDSVFHAKDSALSSSREQLEYALGHRRPSRYTDADSLHRAVRQEVGLDP